MTIWISDRLVPLGISLMLAGCAPGPEVTKRDFNLSRPAPDTIAVAGKAVIVGGPPGYCVDRSASRLRGESAFVLLGSCASISRNARANKPPQPGILTASIAKSSGDPIGLNVLETYVTSTSGKAAMARDGMASSVRILETLQHDDAVFIHLQDQSATGTPGLDDTYWRAVFDLNGRLITASVVSFTQQPFSREAGFETLLAFLGRIRAETSVNVVGASENTSSKLRSGVLQNLFR